MAATPLAPVTTTGPAVYPGAQPMASEQVDARLTRLDHLLANVKQVDALLAQLEHLLAELEAASNSLAAAAANSLAATSRGAAGAPETARYLPGDSSRPSEVAELGDVSDCPF
jgi:hypothetical protein